MIGQLNITITHGSGKTVYTTRVTDCTPHLQGYLIGKAIQRANAMRDELAESFVRDGDIHAMAAFLRGVAMAVSNEPDEVETAVRDTPVMQMLEEGTY